jgi:hypothetical protein
MIFCTGTNYENKLIPHQFICGAKPPTANIPISSLQQVERLICPSSQGDLPTIKPPADRAAVDPPFPAKSLSAKYSYLGSQILNFLVFQFPHNIMVFNCFYFCFYV